MYNGNNRNPVLTLTDLGLTIAVWFDRYDGDRSRYGYSISDAAATPDEAPLAEGTDLSMCGDPDLPEAMRTLLTFYSAAVESYDYERRTGRKGENSDLFPKALLDLGISSDEVQYAASWLGEDDD